MEQPEDATARGTNIMTSRERHQFTVPAGGAGMPTAVRHRAPRETGFATGPSVAASPTSGPRENPLRPTSVTAPKDDTRRSRPGEVLIAALPRICLKTFPANWLIPRWRAAPVETVIASLGSVEIRRIPAGCIAQTCVKGDLAQARETAPRRLAKYTHGNNRGGAIVDAVRPVMHRQRAPGRWLVAVRLARAGDALTSPAPCAPKVKLVSRAAEMFAVVRVPASDTCLGHR